MERMTKMVHKQFVVTSVHCQSCVIPQKESGEYMQIATS